jgi:uncharacterized membrane protein (UPF0127 family)
MMRVVSKALLFLALVIPGAAMADESLPLTYTRTHIIIARKHISEPAQPVLPWLPQGQATANANLIFDVEVRDAASLYNQKGWFNLSSPSEKSGILIVFAVPTVAPISPATQYSPLDILFVNREGKITQILPNINLSELQEDIYPASPILAFLFLKGGASESLAIAPGDEVQYKLFRKPPTILNATPTTPPATP